MPPENKSRRLGRGLEALIANPASAATSPETQGNGLREIPIGEIRPNPFQPRREFKESDLSELRDSLAASGLLQPVTVRRAPDAEGWELVAGERRLRAATGLGWKTISAVEKEFDDRALLTLALVENLQRTDLNPIEEAEGYRRLAEEFSVSHQEIAGIVGKSRSTVANALRILQLPDEIRAMVGSGLLSAGHARALLSFDNSARAAQMAKAIVDRGLSVRDVERAAKRESGKESQPGRTKLRTATQAEVRSIENRVRKRFQTDVRITMDGAERGAISIQFYSSSDLERVLNLMGIAEVDS